MQAGKNLHLYTHIYSGLLIFSTHFFSAKKSSIWRGDVPYSKKKKHPCLFVPYGNPCSYIGGYRVTDFPGFPFTFSALFRTSGARTWARHDFGHPSLWSLGNFEAMESGGKWGFNPHTTWKSYGNLMTLGLYNLWKIDENWLNHAKPMENG